MSLDNSKTIVFTRMSISFVTYCYTIAILLLFVNIYVRNSVDNYLLFFALLLTFAIWRTRMTHVNNNRSNLGRIIKQQRVMIPMTLQELAAGVGVSASHLGRVERGERYPSARILCKIAKPLGFEESELFTLAGYLSPQSSGMAEVAPDYRNGQLDPCVARMLSQEPIEVQRAVIGILTILKSIAKGINE